jgi:hypothetical protein
MKCDNFLKWILFFERKSVIIGKYIPAGTGLRRYREMVPVENN